MILFQCATCRAARPKRPFRFKAEKRSPCPVCGEQDDTFLACTSCEHGTLGETGYEDDDACDNEHCPSHEVTR